MDNRNILYADRRGPIRYPVTIDGEIYFGTKGAPIRVTDISEEGIGFEIDKDVFHQIGLHIGNTIYIQFADDYNWDDDEFETVLMLQTQIKRICENKESFSVGGVITQRSTGLDSLKCIYDRKVTHFITITGFDCGIGLQAR